MKRIESPDFLSPHPINQRIVNASQMDCRVFHFQWDPLISQESESGCLQIPHGSALAGIKIMITQDREVPQRASFEFSQNRSRLLDQRAR